MKLIGYTVHEELDLVSGLLVKKQSIIKIESSFGAEIEIKEIGGMVVINVLGGHVSQVLSPSLSPMKRIEITKEP